MVKEWCLAGICLWLSIYSNILIWRLHRALERLDEMITLSRFTLGDLKELKGNRLVDPALTSQATSTARP